MSYLRNDMHQIIRKGVIKTSKKPIDLHGDQTNGATIAIVSPIENLPGDSYYILVNDDRGGSDEWFPNWPAVCRRVAQYEQDGVSIEWEEDIGMLFDLEDHRKIKPLEIIIPYEVGDVFSIGYDAGFAYLQAIGIHPIFGALVRIFDGMHATADMNVDSIVKSSDRFFTFMDVSYNLKLDFIRRVGHVPIVIENDKYPLFRRGASPDINGRMQDWYVIDPASIKTLKLNELTEADRRIPVLCIFNYLNLRDVVFGKRNVDFDARRYE
ncbi:MAG: hypothetical protein QG626_259 [Patescibacteria group bacterium]|nr:hypothetical protein [Patescibacteria group bacterium]MDQ5952132.1 hypothetical protein [Patescibacteria group bacterium]